MFAKETNESAISALVDALITHQGNLVKNDIPVEDKITKLVCSGLIDKRSKFKSGWAVSISEMIWNISKVNPAAIAFSKAVAKNFFTLFNDIASNSIQASQNGTIIAGYAISAITLGKWLEWQESQLSISFKPFSLILVQLVKSEGILNITIAVSPKPSFLLNERIYTKLSAERDQLWAINAFEATAMRALAEMGNAWSIATIYFIVNPKLSRKVRSAAKNMLEKVLIAITPDILEKAAEIVILGIEEWLRQVNDPLYFVDIVDFRGVERFTCYGSWQFVVRFTSRRRCFDFAKTITREFIIHHSCSHSYLCLSTSSEITPSSTVLDRHC